MYSRAVDKTRIADGGVPKELFGPKHLFSAQPIASQSSILNLAIAEVGKLHWLTEYE